MTKSIQIRQKFGLKVKNEENFCLLFYLRVNFGDFLMKSDQKHEINQLILIQYESQFKENV